MKKLIATIVVIAVVVVAFVLMRETSEAPSVVDSEIDTYNPAINPAEFSTNITNPYFSLPVGRKLVYEAATDEGVERIEILIPGWTREIMGVETLVFWDRVYVNGELVEDTRDYIAQHENGDVWYFGEHVDNYEDGELKDHHGAWLGGVDGALPGIWMKARPAVGDEYRQEYYIGEAEDMGRIVAVGESVTVPAGTYDDCVNVFEFSPIDPATANKFHCSGIGATVLEIEDDERVELIEIDENGALGVDMPNAYIAEGVQQ